MVRVFILHPSGREIAPWVFEELERCALPYEVASLGEAMAFPPFASFVVLGSSLWTEDEVAELAWRFGVNPLSIAVFPYEEVGELPEAKAQALWRNFLRTLSLPKTPVVARRVTPTRKVLFYPEGNEALREAFAKSGIPGVSLSSFSLLRDGMDFVALPHNVRVGACILVPSVQEEAPCPLPQEVLETKRVVSLGRLFGVLGLSPLRKTCIVLLVPSPHPYPEDWEKIFSLALLPPQGAQVVVLAEDIFVAHEGFEEAFRRAREAGVIFEKLPLSRVALSPSPDMRRVVVEYLPEKDAFPVRFEAHWLVPVAQRTFLLPPFSDVFVSDREVSLAVPENPGALPFATNIPGIFVARGKVEDLVASVTRYLAGRVQEEGRITVDAERCALCLTCLRSCPSGAIELRGNLKRCVAVNEALCARCGICAGLCPAKAIAFEVVDRVLGNREL